VSDKESGKGGEREREKERERSKCVSGKRKRTECGKEEWEGVSE